MTSPSLLGAEGQQHHEFLYWEFGEHNGPMQAVRFGDWKALRFWDKETMTFKSPELYNLVKDPGEGKNLAQKYPEIVDQAMSYIDSARTEHPEYPLTLIQKSSGN